MCNRIHRSLLFAALMGLPGSGCQMVADLTQPFIEPFADHSADLELRRQYRDRFQTTGDHASLHWLLAHAVHSGMTVDEVTAALGRTGEREFGDMPLKTHGGEYLTTDVTYRWGPDSQGGSVYLMFRDGLLVNFDPAEFAPGGPQKLF